MKIQPTLDLEKTTSQNLVASHQEHLPNQNKNAQEHSTKSTLNPNIESRGIIKRAYVSENKLHVEGNLFYLNGNVVDSFKVRFGEKEFFTAHPAIDGINKKDFSLQFSLNKVPTQIVSNLKKSLQNIDTSVEKRQRNIRKGLAYFLPFLFKPLYGQAIKSQKPLLTVIPFSNGKECYEIHGLYNILAPIPLSKEVSKIGGGNLLETSTEFLNIMTGYGGLKKTDHVLDVGCGLGRMAYSLAYYLDPSARYEGFDIMPSLISRSQNLSPHTSQILISLMSMSGIAITTLWERSSLHLLSFPIKKTILISSFLLLFLHIC